MKTLDFNNIIHDSTPGMWQRPRTTRRYLSPPRSERLFTMWAEGKIIMGENHLGEDFRDYPRLDASGIWIAHTRHARPLDFRKTKNSLPENGAPVHKIENSYGAFAVEVEAFCNTDRRSTCFIKASVTNTGIYRASERLAFIIRSGKENTLINGSPDEYLSYMPEISEFKGVLPTFKRSGNVFWDKDVFVSVNSPLPFDFDENEGIIWLKPELEPNESVDFYLSLGKGEFADFDYEIEKQKTLAFWDAELLRINNLPQKLKNDEKSFKMIQNMVVQTLQCVCGYVGTNYTVLRQGGLQRLIWPWEAMPSIAALSRIGDFDSYVQDVLDFYFYEKQMPDGEIRPLGEGWAVITSSAIASAAIYCRERNKREYFKKIRDKLLKSFDWICQKRREISPEADAVKGIFPPMRSTDWPQVFQNWTVTDAYSVIALDEFCKTLRFFGDPAFDTVKAEKEDYSSTLFEIFEKIVDFDKNSPEIRVPLTPNGDDKFFIEAFYPVLFEATVLRALIDKISKSTLDRLKARFERIGFCQNGLYGHMPYPDGNTHVWYTSLSDYDWFILYREFGCQNEAFEIIDAQIKYSMTNEYYMIERYNDLDPYFVPWCPNVSAMGRLINMLLDVSQ